MRFTWLLLYALLQCCAGHPAFAEYAGRHTILFGNTATAATATGTGEQILATYSLPANALNSIGRRLWIHGNWSKAANTNTVTFRLYFGAQAFTATSAVSSAGSEINAFVTKSGSNTQIMSGWAVGGTGLFTPGSAATTATDTAAIVIKATCQDTTSAASDCVLQDFFVEWMN
jgi:hypothetical protein